VQKSQQALGNHPGILVHQQDRAEADQQNKNAFDEFEGSDQPQNTPLRRMHTGFRCRRGHATALGIFRISRPPQN
jgi:hypothetical protein